MSQGSRKDRVADQIRSELALLIAREVHDPGIGFLTITRVQVSPDLQQARVFYTALGDEKALPNPPPAPSRPAPHPPARSDARRRFSGGKSDRVCASSERRTCSFSTTSRSPA